MQVGAAQRRFHTQPLASSIGAATTAAQPEKVICCVCPRLRVAVHWREGPLSPPSLALFQGGSLLSLNGGSTVSSNESTVADGATASGKAGNEVTEVAHPVVPDTLDSCIFWTEADAWAWPTVSPYDLSESVSQANAAHCEATASIAVVQAMQASQGDVATQGPATDGTPRRPLTNISAAAAARVCVSATSCACSSSLGSDN